MLLPLTGSVQNRLFSETALGNSIRCYGCSVKSKHANGLKHQTQALMGATRLASG